MIGKLLGMAAVGGTVAGLLDRFLSGVAKVMVLAIVSAFMFCLLLTGGLYLTYLCLVDYGFAPYAAAMTVGGVAFSTTAILIAFTLLQMRRLREWQNRHLPFNVIPSVEDIAGAFIDGLLSPEK